ncbi:MAG: phosphate signaling complex protein PhoU [Hellea sp.]|nr:phosphate signaling complex protein PhoU [Hellea sp.]
MGEHIVKSFDDEMKGLSVELVRMGEIVVDQITSAMKALKSRDLQIAERVNKNDKQVDAINDDIEERVMSILALRHPYAVDLRDTIAALKIARELERIGDLAKNCSMRTGVIIEDEKIKGTKKILKMGRQVAANVTAVMKAYEERDAEAALDIWFGDEAIDNYCNAIFETVLTGMMADNSSVNACTQMTFVAKNLERIGDHATNIASAIHFVVTAESIREKRPKSDRTSTTIFLQEDDENGD